MDIPVRVATLAEFEQLIHLPENANKRFEFIAGEIIEVPSSPYSSEIAVTIGFYLNSHLRENSLDGHVTGEGGGYQVLNERYIPSAAYISSARQPQVAREGYNPNPPELVVEVLSPSDQEKPHLIRVKITNYLAVGTTVWVVDPETQHVEVHAPGQATKVLDRTGTLDGSTILSGFSLAVTDIFPNGE